LSVIFQLYFSFQGGEAFKSTNGSEALTQIPILETV